MTAGAGGVRLYPSRRPTGRSATRRRARRRAKAARPRSTPPAPGRPISKWTATSTSSSACAAPRRWCSGTTAMAPGSRSSPFRELIGASRVCVGRSRRRRRSRCRARRWARSSLNVFANLQAGQFQALPGPDRHLEIRCDRARRRRCGRRPRSGDARHRRARFIARRSAGRLASGAGGVLARAPRPRRRWIPPG